MTHLIQAIEKPTFAKRVTDYGQAILVIGALIGASYTVLSRTIKTVNAGPDALVKTESLDRRVTKLEKQSRFVVHGIEQLTHSHYKKDADEE